MHELTLKVGMAGMAKAVEASEFIWFLHQSPRLLHNRPLFNPIVDIARSRQAYLQAKESTSTS
jgi:hypothetical protein